MILFTPFRKLIDLVVTSILWIYYIFGFGLIFAPYVAWLYVSKKNDEFQFQELFHTFHGLFFKLILFLVPGTKIKIDPQVLTIRSSIIVCNHQSYLDPLLFVSLFKKHKTIVKSTFFMVPVFGWFLKKTGYVPSSANGKHMALVVRHLGSMREYLESGGNLFIFPEGTRSRDGNLNAFNSGAFSIASQSQVTVRVVYIKNTGQLFKPGTGLFNTCQRNIIVLEHLGVIDPKEPRFAGSAEKMAEEAKRMIQERMNLEMNSN